MFGGGNVVAGTLNELPDGVTSVMPNAVMLFHCGVVCDPVLLYTAKPHWVPGNDVLVVTDMLGVCENCTLVAGSKSR